LKKLAIQPPTNQPTKPFHFSTIQSNNQTIKHHQSNINNQPSPNQLQQSNNQTIKQSNHQPTNQPTNQSTNQPINQSTNQLINHQFTNLPVKPISQSSNQPPKQNETKTELPK